jgi:hypothetical protein
MSITNSNYTFPRSCLALALLCFTTFSLDTDSTVPTFGRMSLPLPFIRSAHPPFRVKYRPTKEMENVECKLQIRIFATSAKFKSYLDYETVYGLSYTHSFLHESDTNTFPSFKIVVSSPIIIIIHSFVVIDNNRGAIMFRRLRHNFRRHL